MFQTHFSPLGSGSYKATPSCLSVPPSPSHHCSIAACSPARCVGTITSDACQVWPENTWNCQSAPYWIFSKGFSFSQCLEKVKKKPCPRNACLMRKHFRKAATRALHKGERFASDRWVLLSPVAQELSVWMLSDNELIQPSAVHFSDACPGTETFALSQLRDGCCGSLACSTSEGLGCARGKLFWSTPGILGTTLLFGSVKPYS